MMLPAWAIIIAIVGGAVLGWLGCWYLKAKEWRDRAWAALDVGQSYAACYFKSQANPKCEVCLGNGFRQHEFFIQPCRTCFGEVVERVTNGRVEIVRLAKSKPGQSGQPEVPSEGNQSVSGEDSTKKTGE